MNSKNIYIGISVLLSLALSVVLYSKNMSKDLVKKEFENNITPKKVVEQFNHSNYQIFSLDGKKIDLDSLKNRVILLNFFEPWCKACNKEFPILEKVATKYKNNDKFVILAISSGDDMDMLKNWMKTWGYKNIIFGIDKSLKMNTDFKVRNIPASYLINRDGTIDYQMIGDRNYYSDSFTNYIDRMIN